MGKDNKRMEMVPMIVHMWRYEIRERRKKKWVRNRHACNVQEGPSVTSPPLLGATPTARSGDNLVVFLFLDPSQCISHFKTPNATQLGGHQLAPVSFEGYESVLQFFHSGGKATIAVDFHLE